MVKAVFVNEESISEILERLDGFLSNNQSIDQFVANGLDDVGFAELLWFFQDNYDRLHCERLDLSKCKLSIDSSVVLGEALSNESTFASLRFLELADDNLRERHFVSISMALQKSKLQSLNLSKNSIAGSDAASAMKRLLTHNKSIETLQLSQNKWNQRHIAAIAEGLQQNSTIQCLDLSRNGFGNRGVSRLLPALDPHQSSCQLRSLDLSYNRIRETGASGIADFLFEDQELLSLNLSNNCIGPKGAFCFQKSLRKNHTLTHLNLSHNNIEDYGAMAVANGLLDPRGSNLKELDLSWNSLKDEGAQHLATVIQSRSILERLFLSCNAIGNLGMADLAHAVHVDHVLVELDLVGNQMTDPTPFVDLLKKDTYTLEILRLEKNKVTETQEAEIRRAFLFVENMRTWLRKTIHKFDSTQRMTLRLDKYTYGDDELVSLAQRLRNSQCSISTAFIASPLVSDRGIVALANTNKLERVYVSTPLLTAAGALSLANSSASVISLTNCVLGPESARAITLWRNATLTSLSLEANDIKDEGARALLSSRLLVTLKSLNLAYNRLSDKAVVGLSTMGSIECLHLNGNEITDHGALDLAKAILVHNELRWLNLSENSLSMRGVTVLQTVLRNDLVLECDDQNPIDTNSR